MTRGRAVPDPEDPRAIFSLLYYATPNVKQPRFRWFTPGGLLALLGWVVGSAGFAFYIANFSSYDKTYGTLAAVVVFLVWLWISNVARKPWLRAARAVC